MHQPLWGPWVLTSPEITSGQCLEGPGGLLGSYAHSTGASREVSLLPLWAHLTWSQPLLPSVALTSSPALNSLLSEAQWLSRASLPLPARTATQPLGSWLLSFSHLGFSHYPFLPILGHQ